MSFDQMKDKVKELNLKSPAGNELTEAKQFNMMFKTHLGPVPEEKDIVYLRPETAQAMFVDFRLVQEASRKKIPFGIAQIGKAFRNEITPGNYIFRVRELEQMEIEYFIAPPKADADWQRSFDSWVQQVRAWVKDDLGLKLEDIIEHDIPDGERAHYSKRTIDFEYKYPFGVKELYGLAYRTDFDLKNHIQSSGMNLMYRDPETAEEYIPHSIKPSFGVDRSILAVLCNSYFETEEGRVILKLPVKLAPYKAAVFPLLANKPELINKARKIYNDLKKNLMFDWNDRENIGKRYP